MSEAVPPRLPAGLLAALPPELARDAGVRDLFARFVAAEGYVEELALDLIDVAAGAAGDAWEVRRIAALMLQEQVLRLPVRDESRFLVLLGRLGLLAPGGKAVAERVLAEGYTTTAVPRFARQLRRRLARAGPVLRPLRARPVPARAWRDFLHLARQECKLALARYLFSAEEVVERIQDQVRCSSGVERDFAYGRPYVGEELDRALARLPAYEREIFERLSAGWWIYWAAEATPGEMSSLVEVPATTVVLVVKPPGSNLEFELKRAGRRGDQPLGAVFERGGVEVAPSHRFDGASLGHSLQWEVVSGSLLSRLYRVVHRKEAPMSRVLSMASISSVPSVAGDVAILDYFTLPHCFGQGFRRMRRDLRRTVEAFDHESGNSLDELQGALGLTVRFLRRGSLAQAILGGTSSFRIDRMALYLSKRGPNAYFRQGLGCSFRSADARRLADDMLEEALGVYTPPPVPYRGHAAYVQAALSLPVNRSRADRTYISLMRQIGTFWGVLTAAKGHSQGESVVARNVGLRSVWRGGRWQVEILFMDHDSLHLGGRRGDDFFPIDTTAGMRDDALYLLGGGTEVPSLRGTVEYLEQIYQVGRDVARQGRAALFEARAASARKTREKLASRRLRPFFRAAYLKRIRDCDALFELYARCDPPPAGKALRALVDGFLRPRGHPDSVLDECTEALKDYGAFLASLTGTSP